MLALALMLASASPGSAHHVRLDAESVVIESQWEDTAAPLGVALPPGATLDVLDSHRLRLTIPAEDAARVLPLPVPEGDGVHRITFDRAVVFQPATALELAPRGTHAVDHGVHGDDVRRLDRTFGAPQGSARYLRTSSLQEHGGVPGSLEDRERRRQRLLLLAGGAFVFVIAALAALARAVGKRAELERADAVLAQEIEQLGA